MSVKKNKKLKVHKDINKDYYSPYWQVSVYLEPQFPSDQYGFPVKNQRIKDEFLDDDDIKFPCGYCLSKETTLIWASASFTNAGGTMDYEIKCKDCDTYTFYEGQEFS